MYDGPRRTRKNYCAGCAGPIVAAAREDLARLEKALGAYRYVVGVAISAGTGQDI